ncbi:hypothetical protein C7212DRAFT_363300 [Tuber magnatum]|uniref:BZIP domain-containing protein n=1 Tax=Tuber magnatum TaxID=42249 RepID=A0A317SPQ7_9PEZI|nr:hypothetical protein C7212DRAFT_363300 [Tuber magnatum]
MSAGNNIHPSPVHPQYLQPRQQQHTSFSGSPHHSGHQSGGTSPYSPSFPMNSMNPNLPAPTSYAQGLPSRASSHPAPSSNSQQQQQQQQNPQPGGFLDPTAYLNMGDVMGMDMDPIPMGSNMDMDLSILSAEEHGDLRVLQDRGRGRDRLHTQRLHSMSHPDGPDGAGRGRGAVGGRRKRSESDDSVHEPVGVVRGTSTGNRKQRGRPRLDTKDENAADRRRTQIRLAQRAYRLRKETTISSLRSRVTELENAIDGMQSTFLELHESAMKCLSKSNDAQNLGYGTNLKELTERFLSLAKGALGSSEGADSHDDEGEGENNGEGGSGARSKRRRSRDEDGGPASGGMQTNGPNGVASYGGYEVSYTRQNNSRDSFNNNNGSQSRNNGDGRSDATTGHMDSSPTSNPYSDACLSSSPESGYANYVQPNNNPLQAATQFRQEGPLIYEGFSYSFHETSLSRRLHRAALEHAHFMLTSPNANPQEVARMFAYTFCYLSKADVIRVVNRLLNTTTKDSLDIRDYPEILPKGVRPEVMEAYLCNSDTSVFTDGLTGEDMKDFDIRLEAKKAMLKMGINQKFLRPDEVEKYIMELGILNSNRHQQQQSHLIDPSLVETGKTRSSSQQLPKQNPGVPEGSTDYLTANRMATPSYLVHPAVTPSPSSSPSANARESRSPSLSPHVTMEKKLGLFGTHSPPTPTNVLGGVKKNIDIDVFVNRCSCCKHYYVPDARDGDKRVPDVLVIMVELVKKGICLGRFPGFKKSDVEEAIRAAWLGVGVH